jgi:peroxiredoxin Q/BCP
MLKAGDKAPRFTLPSDGGGSISLGALRGQTVVLYFYPKDDTSGCTTESCEFRDSWKAVRKAGATILGVSPDGVASHARFRKKFRLPFPLLADEGHEIATAYGVWGEKSMYGRKYLGILRTTFIIDGKGTIVKVFERVRPKGHAAAVLEALQS